MPSHFLNKCFVVSSFIAAIEVVSGMPFGQERTQFCEFPQPSMPPSSIKRFQTLVLVHFTCWVSIEQANLRDRCRSDKAVPVIHVRASFQANAASHAFGQLVRPLTFRFCHTRSRTKIIRSIDRNPCFNLLKRVEHPLTVDDKVTNNREGAHRCKPDRLLQLIDKR